MNVYIVTSKKFIGQVTLWFNAKGTISLIDLTGADMDAVLTSQFIRSTPLTESNLQHSYSNETTVVAGEFKVTFDQFWLTYDKKINRKRCLPLWEKLSTAQKVQAFYGIKDYDKYLLKINRIKCDPENYLRNEMWDNEYK